jgi:hypothetical protein
MTEKLTITERIIQIKLDQLRIGAKPMSQEEFDDKNTEIMTLQGQENCGEEDFRAQ